MLMTLLQFLQLQAYSTPARLGATYGRDLVSSVAHCWLLAILIMYDLLPLLKLSGWEQALRKLPHYRKHIPFILHFIAAAYLAEKSGGFHLNLDQFAYIIPI